MMSRRAVIGVNRVRNERDGLPFGIAERELAERVLVNCENLQTLLEDVCHRLRAKVSWRGL